MTADHPFEPNPNPRKPRSCATCGRVPEVHPILHEDLADPPRDTDFEREFVHESARVAGVNIDDLYAFAISRADEGPVRRFLTRDLRLDAQEEIADLLWYLTWKARQAQILGRDLDDVHRCQQALSYAMLAWRELTDVS